MADLKRLTRLGLAACASMGMVTASSTALAQYDPQNCSQVAWSVCSYDENGRPIQVTFECFEAEYERCVNGSGGAIGAFKQD